MRINASVRLLGALVNLSKEAPEDVALESVCARLGDVLDEAVDFGVRVGLELVEARGEVQLGVDGLDARF